MNYVKTTRLERFALGIGETVSRRPWLAIFAAVLLVAATGFGAKNLEFTNNYRVFFGPTNPELQTFEEFQNTYTKNDNIMFVVKPSGDEVFTPEVAGAIERITLEAWQIPYTIRVDSITNFQHSWADGDDLTVGDLIRNGAELSEAALSEKAALALGEPLLNGSLLAADAATTGVNVTLQYPEQSLTEVPRAVGVARTIAAGIEADYPDLTVALTGVSMLNNAFAEAGIQDAMTLIPIMYLVLIVLMVIVLRGVASTMATLLVVAFATVTALGLAGYTGLKLTPISVTAPVIIMTLAIADSVHILVSMLSLMGEGWSKRDALKESLRINILAVTITSLTTIVGFLTLNFSDSPPFWHLGNVTAVGIVAAWLYSLLLLPAVVTLLPIKGQRRRGSVFGITAALDWLAGIVTRHHRGVLVATASIAVLLVAGISKLELNDEFVEYFDERVEFRRDADFADEHLTGIYLIEFSVEGDGPGGVNEPRYLSLLDEFTTWLKVQPEVRHVYSYTDIAKRLNRNMHGDDPDWYTVPDSRNLAAQYLLLYELSLPYGLDLNDRINIDKSATRVTVTLDDVSTVEGRIFYDRAEAWLRGHAPESMWAVATGAPVMFAHISQRNIESMLKGNSLAVILIALIMIVALRSTALGIFSLVPNSIPIFMTFGVWALTVGQVGMAAATVSATSLGIIVDDTVHFLTKYVRARREKGLATPDAIRYAFRTVGVAIVSTTLILSAGFAVLSFSTFSINAEMGLLTALAVVIALFVDFLLLPALLMTTYRVTDDLEENYEDVIPQTV